MVRVLTNSAYLTESCPELAKLLSEYFGTTIYLKAVKGASDQIVLAKREQAIYEGLDNSQKESYLRSRAALKSILMQLDANEDTTLLEFPHKQFSLTHSGRMAVAAGMRAGNQTGIGVDYEIRRPTKPAMGRFFMTKKEQSWLTALPIESQPQEVLRLWTIKEALFKADPDNRNMVLSDYAVLEPGESAGLAVTFGNETRKMRYFSIKLENEEEGYLSLAISTS